MNEQDRRTWSGATSRSGRSRKGDTFIVIVGVCLALGTIRRRVAFAVRGEGEAHGPAPAVEAATKTVTEEALVEEARRGGAGRGGLSRGGPG